MEFKPLTTDDRIRINRLLGDNPSRSCVNTFGVMYLWNVRMEYKACIEENMLYFGGFTPDAADFYYPTGNLPPEISLKNLEEYCKENALKLRFSFLTEEQAELVKNFFGDRIVLEEDRDWADYIYNYEDLTTLRGKKYHGQRNHINRFSTEYPDYEYLPYSQDMKEQADKFMEEYYETLIKDSDWFEDEKKVMKRLLNEYPLTGQMGCVIRIGGKIVAMSFGETLGDTLYVHFEKALRHYSGSYAVINKRFAECCYKEGLAYINREEDLGDPGLRTAKLSLHPAIILKKYFGGLDG